MARVEDGAPIETEDEDEEEAVEEMEEDEEEAEAEEDDEDGGGGVVSSEAAVVAVFFLAAIAAKEIAPFVGLYMADDDAVGTELAALVADKVADVLDREPSPRPAALLFEALAEDAASADLPSEE